MGSLRNHASILFFVITCGAQIPAVAFDEPPPLAAERQPASAVLPFQYPKSWIFVDDLNLYSPLDSRFVLVDIDQPDHAVLGQIPAAQFGNLLQSSRNGDIYVSETFYSRLTRGTRADVITIWDPSTLAPKGEILLKPRGLFAPLKNAMQFANNEEWILIFNFTPATSVAVVDVRRRKILAEIPLPGCSLIYPTVQRGFASLCGDGKVLSVVLDEAGKVASTSTTAVVNRIDDDAFFSTPAMVGKTAWFATFRGNVHGIDLSGDAARDLGAFSLGQEEGGDPEWRPSGYEVVASSPDGDLFVLMNPHGREGSHKDGGTEVWTVDMRLKRKKGSIHLANPAIGIAISNGKIPELIAILASGSLDVYDAGSGAFRHSIRSVAYTPMSISGAAH